MKKQSEAEWLSDKTFCLSITYGNIYSAANSRRLIAALKRRGWTPPKKGKGKK